MYQRLFEAGSIDRDIIERRRKVWLTEEKIRKKDRKKEGKKKGREIEKGRKSKIGGTIREKKKERER